ncbi:MAG TPA: acetate--CoA ligase family protein [Desulfosalsimonadaceae bacterium]|nr:acetate--CoA ligase family protein [Desulfosalsimonadaceae bacterium]
MIDKLDAIFAPESVAVVGASSTPGKVGHDIFANVLRGEYKGTLYPVNPKARSILSVRCYASVLDIPDPIDLAMLILPPRAALASIDECIEKGVKGVVIVSAGFKEVGGEGAEIEDQIAAKCRDAGIPLIGPNCLGVINPGADVRLNASFSTRIPHKGNISFISQSGALCTAVLDFAADRGFGFSKFVSIGNKADVEELDLLKYYHNDPETDVIMVYMEELRMRENFIEEVKEITSGERPTPVLVIKSGKTAAGARAAASHTGSLAGTEAVYDALFNQAGIIRVETVDDLFDYAEAFSARRMPTGNRVAIITNAGGPGIIATDMTEVSGLSLASFSRQTDEALHEHLPPTANFNNPVDVIGDASRDRYEHALEAVIKDEGVDGVLMILTPQSMTDAIGTAEAIVSAYQKTQKPIICSFMGVVDVSAGVKHLQEHHIPVYRFPENAARAMGKLYEATRWLHRRILPQYDIRFDKARARQLVEESLSSGRSVLGEYDGAPLLACYGFHVCPMKLARNASEAGDIADELGYPVVMKVYSRQILHKSDAGGVQVNVKTRDAVEQSFTEIWENGVTYAPDAEIEGVLVQQMAPGGEEVILGVNRYPGFGHLIMFGFGGIYVELFKNVVFRLAPIGRNTARRMIRSIKGFELLNGFRGRPKADIGQIEKLLVGLSQLVVDNPEIKELDINPLFVHEEGKGATVADIIITLDSA